MENKSCRKICRFCLETSNSNFETIEEVTFANLDFLWLKLNLSISELPVMCGVCAKTIRNYSDFKTKCLDIENYIVSSAKYKDSIQIDLREVYVRKMLVESIVNVPEEYMVCRLCLELIKNYSAIFLRYSTDIVLKLEQYFPELDLACTEDPVICVSCQVSLQRYFSFANTCLTSEEKITEYCKVEGTNGMGQIDLNSVVHFISKNFLKCKLEVDTLKIEETGNYDSENASNDVEIKKEEIVDVELDIKEEYPEQDSVLTEDNSFQCHPSPSQSDCVPGLTRAKRKRTCKICGYQNNRSGLMRAHVLAHKGIVQEFNCEMCPFKTTTKEYLKKHMFKHKDASELTIYKCALCSYQGKRKRQLQLHMITHQDDTELTLYKCDLCAYETKHKRCLRRHMLVHKDKSEIEMHKCKLCSYETKWRDTLRKHVLAHTNTPLVVVKPSTWYKCDLCDFETKWKKSLKRHMMLTHKPRSEVSKFSCHHCGFKTIYKKYLTKHMVMHMDDSEIKIYKCDTFENKCRDSFRSDQNYYGNTPGNPDTVYKCDQCDFETKWKKSLKVHMLTHQTHSEIMMYKCYHCEYESKRKGDLRRHMLTHQDPSKITMLECDHCDYETTHKENLQKHMRQHKG